MKLAHEEVNCDQKPISPKLTGSSKNKKKERYEKKQAVVKNKQNEEKNKNLRRREKKEERSKRKLEKERVRINTIAQQISDFFGEENIERIARATNFLIRKGKLLPLTFLVVLAFSPYGNSSKLTSLTGCLHSWFKITVGIQAISERLMQKKTLKFFKTLFLETLQLQFKMAFENKYSRIFHMFKGVFLEDSTQFQLPESCAPHFKGFGGGASKAGMKLDFTMDITKNAISYIEVTSGSTSDKTIGGKIKNYLKKGALYIRDLGYFDTTVMWEMIDQEAYFLSRLQKDVKVFLSSVINEAIDIKKFLEEGTKNGNTIDQDVYISGQKLPVRLIAEKVPEEVKAQRVNRYKDTRKKEPSEDYVTWVGYSIYVTNIPKEMIASASLIITIYKVRWNIELFFKRLKSIIEIDVIAVENPNGILCMVYAKLIGILIGEVIVSYAASICDEDEELSEYKLVDWLGEEKKLGNAVKNGTLEELLVDMIEIFYLHCKNKRKTNKSLQGRIEDEFHSKFDIEKPKLVA